MNKHNSIPITIRPFGESTMLVEWPKAIDEMQLGNIQSLQQSVEKKLISCLVETSLAYHSLTLYYHPQLVSFRQLKEAVVQCYHELEKDKKRHVNHWRIPVCYNDCFGIDLKNMAEQKSITQESIIKLHTTSVYTVYFIGFLPGFMYLGGLHPQLQTPRKAQPRLRIEPGAVGIGGEQTGVYPVASPGGWNIIGNSPVTFFDATLPRPCFVQPGDKVSFYSIDRSEHEKILEQVRLHEYHKNLLVI